MLAAALLSPMGLVTGVEPATDCLQNSCSTVEPHQLVESGDGIPAHYMKADETSEHTMAPSPRYPWRESFVQRLSKEKLAKIPILSRACLPIPS